MKDYLSAGDPASITWTHVTIACVVLLVYIALGVRMAFKIDRQRKSPKAGEN